MSETESTLAAPVKWTRGTTGTVSVGRARVKGEIMVEVNVREADGAGHPLLLTPEDATLLAERINAAARGAA
ncbi:MAG: hypothetical protein ACSHXI_07115 [Hoeflea sp.]|uniref:hypothetical protein n=1 Tax=Hoeflea sp. TaxID=1940281 RepID=UPI003EF91717